MGRGATDVAVEGEVEIVGCGPGNGQADPEDGVGPELGLVRRAVEVEQGLVDLALGVGVHPVEGTLDLTVDMTDRVLDTLAAVAVTTVAEFDGLELAGRRS